MSHCTAQPVAEQHLRISLCESAVDAIRKGVHDAVVEAHEKPSVPRPVLDAATRMAMRRNSWTQASQGLMRAYTALLWNAYDGQDLEHNKARVRELADSLKHKLEEHCPSAAAGAGHRAINDWLEASHEE